MLPRAFWISARAVSPSVSGVSTFGGATVGSFRHSDSGWCERSQRCRHMKNAPSAVTLLNFVVAVTARSNKARQREPVGNWWDFNRIRRDGRNRSDPPTNCGNGMVNSVETWDPPGTCGELRGQQRLHTNQMSGNTTTCDDGNACTLDQLTAAPRNCNVACSNTAITDCSGGMGSMASAC